MSEPFNSLCALCIRRVLRAPENWNTMHTKNHEGHDEILING